MNDDDDIQPETEAEDLAKRVADRLKSMEHGYCYVDWVSDEVDGPLSAVIFAVVEELGQGGDA